MVVGPVERQDDDAGFRLVVSCADRAEGEGVVGGGEGDVGHVAGGLFGGHGCCCLAGVVWCGMMGCLLR